MEIKKILGDGKFPERYIAHTQGKWKVTGYARLPNRVFLDGRLGKPERLVYWSLAAHTFKGKEHCFPSLVTIATESRCVKNTVIKAIKGLEKLGYVRVERAKVGSRKTNRYFLLQHIK